MKPIEIVKVLNLAREARTNGDVFNPLFVGPPGVGKSQIVQMWCKENNLPFIDLRAAYLEAPDLIGFPSIEVKNGRQVTVHNVPEFWPTEGEGVLLLEEPNRGTTSVMNTFMQLLTDRKVHNYNLPEKWIIVGCINPETGDFDVNTMDPALKDRFEIFNVEYDKESFVSYMRTSKWNDTLIMFVESGTWSYVSPDKISANEGAKYGSPRTLSKLNAVLNTSLAPEDELWMYESILGRNMGRSFYTFKHDDFPVLYQQLVSDPRTALKKLRRFSKPDNLKNGHLSITIRSILEANTITDDLLIDVLETLPADQSAGLIRELEFKRGDSTLMTRICNQSPEILKIFKAGLK